MKVTNEKKITREKRKVLCTYRKSLKAHAVGTNFTNELSSHSHMQRKRKHGESLCGR